MCSSTFEAFVNKYPELAEPLQLARNYIARQKLGSTISIGSLADFCNTEPAVAERISELLESAGIISIALVPVCRKMLCNNNELSKDTDSGRLYCDLCETLYPRKGLKMEKVRVVRKTVSRNTSSKSLASKRWAAAPSGAVFKPDMAPWANELVHADILLMQTRVRQVEVDEILKRLAKYGIAWFRLAGHSMEKEIFALFEDYLGTACPQQNDFSGKVKEAEPSPDGPAGSATTIGDLDLHVDGTQHDVTPALLVLAYINEADIGAMSIFVDVAKVLADIEEERRIELISSLSRPDAATFKKKGMRYKGPIFTYNRAHNSVTLRCRLDDVIKISPDCQEDFDYFKKLLDDPKYKLTLMPQKGDVIVFDNWRLMHARTRVLGQSKRKHLRMWVSDLNANNKSKISLGLRFADNKVLVAVETANE